MLVESALTVRVAQEPDLTAWQDYVDRTPGAGPLHHAAWYNVLGEAYSVRPYFLFAVDDAGRIAGVLPSYHSRSPLTRSHITSLEGGILAQSPDAVHSLLAEAMALRDRTRAHYLQIRGGPVDAPASTVPTVHTVIETRRDADALWSAVKRKTRWGIRQAEKQELSIEHDPQLAGLEAFYSVYATHMRDLGTPVFGVSTFRAMGEYLGRDRLRLYLAKYRGRLIGGMLCIIHGNSWTDWYAVMRSSEEIEFANYLLYWHVIRDASLHGVESFDLGRSTPGSNVHLFKRKWGGRDIEVPYHFYPSSNARSRDMGLQELKQSKGLAQRVWAHLPLPLCNTVGPLVRKQLPFI